MRLSVDARSLLRGVRWLWYELKIQRARRRGDHWAVADLELERSRK
jgi:hypothetical protein